MKMRLMDKAERDAYVEVTERPRDWDYYKKFDLIEVGCGNVIRVDRSSIENEIWYDDETPDPFGENDERKRECFYEYNIKYRFKDFGFTEWMEERDRLAAHGYCSGRFLERPVIVVWPDGPCSVRMLAYRDDMEWERARGAEFVEMDDEQLASFIDIMTKLRERYIKRLDTYWKRYQNKIWSRGYWANR